MKSTIKYNLGMLYLIVGFIYAVIDWTGHYGEDGLLFWWFIRPIVSLFKGIFWIFFMW